MNDLEKSDNRRIYELEDWIKARHQVEMPTEHAFCAGVYARTMVLVAGAVATGAVHATESFFVVRSGVLALTTDDGVVEVGAGFMAVTKAGTKRAALAITDVVMTEFMANPQELRDPVEIWDHYTVKRLPDAIAEEKKILEVTG